MNWFSRFFQKKVAKHPAIPSSADADQRRDSGNAAPAYGAKVGLKTLKQFAPLRDLPDATINQIEHNVQACPADTIVFHRGENSDGIYYLLQGHLSMQPESENHYQVEAGTPLANLPLNSGKIFGATATAIGEARIIKVSAELNQLWATQNQPASASCVELLDLDLPEEIANQAFFNSFAQAYRNNNLRLPSLPDVAFKLRQAMQNDIGIDEAVEIIHVDPPIVAKLIQVANSSLYGSSSPITNCHDAVNRIGLDATRNLVMSISMKQLFQCKDKDLMKSMQAIWRNSLLTSSLSFVLAQECSSTISPEDAMLAGLIADIGAIPLLHFAEQSPEHYPGLEALEASLAYLRGPVGSLLLHTLGFTGDLVNIPQQAENWLYDGSEQLALLDIVILAKLHSYFGSKKAKDLPYINSIPTYSKICERRLDADFSLMLLQKAKSRIQIAMQLLS